MDKVRATHHSDLTGEVFRFGKDTVALFTSDSPDLVIISRAKFDREWEFL